MPKPLTPQSIIQELLSQGRNEDAAIIDIFTDLDRIRQRTVNMVKTLNREEHTRVCDTAICIATVLTCLDKILTKATVECSPDKLYAFSKDCIKSTDEILSKPSDSNLSSILSSIIQKVNEDKP